MQVDVNSVGTVSLFANGEMILHTNWANVQDQQGQPMSNAAHCELYLKSLEQSGSIPITRMLSRFLQNDTVDPAFQYNANGDYSGGEVEYSAAPPAGVDFIIDFFKINILVPNGSDSGRYGNNLVLTNGLNLTGYRGDTKIGDLNPVPIKTNSDWQMICQERSRDAWGSGVEYLSYTWNLAANGGSIKLSGDLQDKIVVRLQDDLQGLSGHYFYIQGKLDY